MQVPSKSTLMTAQEAFTQMARDAADATHIDIAVAWTGDVLRGPDDPFLGWLSTHQRKTRLVTGITDGMTHPVTLHRALTAFQARGLWIVHPDEGPMFHAKLYAFRGTHKGKRDVVYVGSANLSRAAVHRNAEVLVRTELQAGGWDAELKAWTEPQGLFPANEAWLNRYEPWATAAQAARKGSAQAMPPAPALPKAPLSSGIEGGTDVVQSAFYQSWADHYAWYTQQIAKRTDALTPDHWLRVRRAVLAMPGWPDPTAMDEEDWKRACGLAGGHHPTYGVDDTTVNWPLFGSVMAISATAQGALLGNKPLIRDALAAIPAEGDITRTDWQRFRFAWRDAGFGAESKAAASRLLALLRPDRFLPLTEASAEAIGRIVNHRPSTLSDYKDVCDKLWDTPWARHDVPPEDDDERTFWAARVALLDVLFYDPTVR